MLDPEVQIYLDTAVQMAIEVAMERTRVASPIAGTLRTIDGPDGWVEPVDDSDNLLAGTLVGDSMAVGDSVIILQLPPSGSFILGPIPT